MVDPSPTRARGSSPDLDPEHRRAICKEIGEQLHNTLAHDAAPVPSQLQGLVERLTELDGGAPPIVPGPADDYASLPIWKRVIRFWRIPRNGP